MHLVDKEHYTTLFLADFGEYRLQPLLELAAELGTGQQRILNGEVPEGLKDKRILSLDLGSLLAGAATPEWCGGD